MRETRLEFGVVSANDRDDFYAELLCDDRQWGEISVDPETRRLKLLIYPSKSGEVLTFELADLQRLLEHAAKRLSEVEGLKTS
jgi:hypothetical protein